MPRFARMPSLLLLTSAVAGVAAASTLAQSIAEENRQRVATAHAEADKSFVIGPSVAGELGYRIVWQARIASQGGAGSAPTTLAHVRVADEGIFGIDSRNTLTRLRPSDGEQLWTVGLASPVDILRGIHWANVTTMTATPKGLTPVVEPRLLISTDTECYVVDASSGSLIQRQRFAKLPSTPPLATDRFLIYGTLGGQVVWHQFLVGQEWRANSPGGTIRGQLVRGGDTIIAASDNGVVMALDEISARARWTRKTYGSITATPAIGSGVVFVPSHDQYLWAFDGRNGQLLWRYFTESPLTTSPFSLGDAVLQYVPNEGLVCLAARPDGQIDGAVRWKNKEAVGVPVGMFGPRIALWDNAARLLTLIDSANGATVAKLPLPQVTEFVLVADGPQADDLFAMSTDGRIERLTPKQPKDAGSKPPASATASDAPATTPAAPATERKPAPDSPASPAGRS